MLLRIEIPPHGDRAAGEENDEEEDDSVGDYDNAGDDEQYPEDAIRGCKEPGVTARDGEFHECEREDEEEFEGEANLGGVSAGSGRFLG